MEAFDSSTGLIRAAERTLQILKVMNQRPVSTIEYLHNQTGLPKPTLVRFLKTMIHAGYVTNDPRQAGYQLTSQVSSLSSGYHGDPLVIEAGRAWAIKLTRQLNWPMSIAVLDGNSMVVRYSTVSDSPVSPFFTTINMHLGLFSRALGRAYVAFCDEDRIERFAEDLIKEKGAEAELVGTPDERKALVESVRKNGYALRDMRVEPKNSNTLAVPIFIDDQVRATLGITFFRSAIKSHNLIREYANILTEASREITEETVRLTRGIDSDLEPPLA